MKLKLNEDWFDEIPEVQSEVIEIPEVLETTEPEDVGVANLIHDLIIAENELIQQYNELLVNANNNEIIEIVSEISAQEMSNIGKLQNALEIVSPNAEFISDSDKLDEVDNTIDDLDMYLNI